MRATVSVSLGVPVAGILIHSPGSTWIMGPGTLVVTSLTVCI
jgi:hypothetical protein